MVDGAISSSLKIKVPSEEPNFQVHPNRLKEKEKQGFSFVYYNYLFSKYIEFWESIFLSLIVLPFLVYVFDFNGFTISFAQSFLKPTSANKKCWL